MVFPTSVNFPAMRPRFSAPWGAMSLMLRCFSARKFSLFPLSSQHENEFFFRKRCCEEMFFENSPTFCRKFATPEPSLPPFSAHPVHPWVKHAAASHTHAHVRPHTRPPQSLFVFCLHPFTRTSQTAIFQHVRCEGFGRECLHLPFTLRPPALTAPWRRERKNGKKVKEKSKSLHP